MHAHRLEHPSSTGRPRRGFALGMVLIFLFALTAALAAGFAANLGERRIDDGGLQTAQALSLAEDGLQRALVDRASIGLTAIPPAAAESVRVNLSQGSVDVLVSQLRPALGTQPALYLIRAHGIRNGARASTGGASAAEQTVTQLASWQVGSMRTRAGWTSITGMTNSDDAVIFSGVDGCGMQPSLPAIAVPASPGFTGNTGTQSGATPLVDTTLAPTPAALAPLVSINWPGILNGSVLNPTVTVPPGSFPSPAQFSDTNFVPIVMINNPPPGGTPWSLPSSGRGLLIVRGDLLLDGPTTWSGVVLVGGTITTNNTAAIYGATVTGLNVQIGLGVPASSVGNGSLAFAYNSCSINMALKASGHFRPFSNTWSTTWPTY